MASESFQNIVREARQKHTATLIFFHGLGGDADSLSYNMNFLVEHEDLGHVKFIFPSAKRMPVTGNRGLIMPSWFDCFSFDIENRREDEPGLYRAVEMANEIIEREQREHGILPERIIIGGISQGGAVSILATITTPRPIGGLCVLSTYVPLRKKTLEIATPFSKSIPIFWGHGTEDRQVNFELAKGWAERLASDLGKPFIFNGPTLGKTEFNSGELHFKSYVDLGHWFNQKELEDLVAWVTAVLPSRETVRADE